MNQPRVCVGLLLTVVFVGIAAESATAGSERYIVTLRETEDPQKVAKEFKFKPKHIYKHALSGFAAALDAEEVKKLRKDKRVVSVEPDGLMYRCHQMNSPGMVWMGITNFPLARINGLDERIDVGVAVLDSGIQSDHPDLNVVRSVVFSDSGNPEDLDGHGTSMAGVIGALDNNFGTVGVAPGVQLWSIKAGDYHSVHVYKPRWFGRRSCVVCLRGNGWNHLGWRGQGAEPDQKWARRAFGRGGAFMESSKSSGLACCERRGLDWEGGKGCAGISRIVS